jgi:hypothetical protein
MTLLLYSLTAAALLWLAHRFVRPLSRAAAIVLFLLPFVFTGTAMLTGRVLAPVDWAFDSEPLKSMRGEYGIGSPHNGVATDIYCAILPWRAAVKSALARGEWPLWNPFILSGDVLAATAQPAPYSPFTLIACLLPIAAGFTFTAAIALLAAGIGAFLFARELDCGEGPAFIAAAGWMYSTGIALYLLWPLATCWALFPLILLATRRVVVEPGVRSWALLTFALTLQLLSGHPETMLHTTALAAAYALFEMIHVGRASARRNGDGLKPVLHALLTAIAAGAATLLLCAIYLLPILEAMPQTAEYVFRTANYTAVREATGFGALVRLATDLFPFLHLRVWVSPRIEEVQAESGAVGSIILALAAYAAWRVRTREKWFFLAMAAFCFAARAGWAPLARVLRNVPLFKITVNERLGFAAAFFLVILAALGCQELLRRRGDRHAVAVTFAVVLAILGVATVTLLRTVVIFQGFANWGEHDVFAELALLGAAVVFFALPTRERLIIPALLGLLLVQRTLEEGGIWPAFPARAAYPPVALLEPLKSVRQPFRIVGLKFAFVPGSNVVYGLEDVRGYGAMTYVRLHETFQAWCVPQAIWFNRVDDLTRPMLSMMNVRFAVAEAKEAVPPGWRKIGEQGAAMLLENENVLPRAFIPRNVRLGDGNAEIVERMAAAGDFAERAWISAEVPPYDRANGPGQVELRTVRRGFDLSARMEGDGWVVVSETAWKGWRAYLDGRRVEMQRANNAFLSIYVPRGNHVVRLRYWPDSFVRGRAISAAAVLGMVAFAIFRRSVTYRSRRY